MGRISCEELVRRCGESGVAVEKEQPLDMEKEVSVILPGSLPICESAVNIAA